jgi:hypothetical protein
MPTDATLTFAGKVRSFVVAVGVSIGIGLGNAVAAFVAGVIMA